MSVTLPISADLETRLIEESRRLGITPGEYVVQLVERQLAQQRSNNTKAEMLRSWMHEGDEQEQRETGEYLIQSLDEDRPGQRKLFPPEKKGLSW